LFTITQFATRGEIWAHLPGVDRLVAVAQTDATVLSRLSIYKTSLGLMTPGEAPLSRLLFGWGNDNYQFAWASHYNPEVYAYDKTVFDRSHNILLDTLVMNGFLGLGVFLVLLFFVYKYIFSLRRVSVELFLLSLFVFTAYILQAMTAPDGIVTSYYFFIFVAYLLHKVIPYENK
jgi:O-antigen ligase